MDGVNKWNTTRQIQAKLRTAKDTSSDKRSEQPLGTLQTLTLNNITLSRGGKALLQNFNLTIKAGSKILLKAPSGFGKTTLLYALQGQLPMQGSYQINGIDAGQLPPRQQLDLFSLIKQQPFLFNDTLRFNLTLGGDYSQDELEEAARRAHLDTLVAEKGWDYQCGENGANLSGGQIQRVEIARAFLVKRPVILADEATSALDDKLSDAIHDELFASGKTVIEVAHHISPEWQAKFDQVIDLTQAA
nr:ABC transporter ATP-binding protein/permease [Lacticaseibacillus jixianensis]